MSEFVPTPAMKRLKVSLSKSMTPDRLKNFDIHVPDLQKIIAPTPKVLFDKWVKSSSEFLDWLRTPQESSDVLYDARERAYQFLLELFDMDMTDAEGKTDAAILKAKMDAAKMLVLGQDNKNGITIQNNNNSLNVPALPKGLKNKTPEAIEGKIGLLEGATDYEFD